MPADRFRGTGPALLGGSERRTGVSFGGISVTTHMRKLCAALALLVGLAPAVSGQEAAPRKIHTRSPVFRLPVQIDDRDRATLKELKIPEET